MAYEIRRAQPGDAAAIVEVARRTWAVTYAGVIPDGIQARALAEWYDPERIARQVANPDAAFVLAIAGGGEVAGFAYAAHRPEPGNAELWRFYVLPEHQKQGLGRRMIHAALQALGEQRRVERLFCQVEKENAVGRRAYEALGFTLVREYDDDLFGHSTRAVELCLHVGDAG